MAPRWNEKGWKRSKMSEVSLFPFENTYARLPERFFERLPPTAVAKPALIRLNENLALQLGLDPEAFKTPDALAVLAGNRVPRGAEPLAMAYAGFQFGGWVPQLGDGRAILLGEVVDRDGVRRDIQLKGSGPTSFSRRGDGRAGVGPVLREYIVSEGMAALGVPTTRALAAVSTGERIMRETPLPGAVLTRVAQSHIRVGTFQFFAARQDTEALRLLADHVIARHYPETADAEDPYLSLIEAVVGRQADLIARWLGVGFIHGVMNTDNTSIAGETIDYGPCAFMDTYHPETVYSSIDQAGRYAYRNQPSIAHWNLAGFAQALLPLLGADEEVAVAKATEAINVFPQLFEAAQLAVFRRKLGLMETRDGDGELAQDLITRMAKNKADFTLTFRRLCDAVDEDPAGDVSVRVLFQDPEAFDAWFGLWQKRIELEAGSNIERRQRMRLENPAFIPRNHLVEEVIQAAVHDEDYSAFEKLLDVLSRPFEEQPENDRYGLPPRPDQVVHQTFCGT